MAEAKRINEIKNMKLVFIIDDKEVTESVFYGQFRKQLNEAIRLGKGLEYKEVQTYVHMAQDDTGITMPDGKTYFITHRLTVDVKEK